MNLVLSNKQPLAPDEYGRCAAEPVFKMAPLSFHVRKISSRERHTTSVWLLVGASHFCRSSNHFSSSKQSWALVCMTARSQRLFSVKDRPAVQLC